jgi:hypothetical protein
MKYDALKERLLAKRRAKGLAITEANTAAMQYEDDPLTTEAAQAITDLEAENERLRGQTYAWLGYWRDQFPPDSVKGLQDVLGSPTSQALEGE